MKINNVKIKKGFPPKEIALSEETLGKTLVEIGIRDKESLIVEGNKAPEEVKGETEPIVPVDDLKVTTHDGFYMQRRIIQANDSCLFNAIGLGVKGSLSMSNELRKVVASKV